MRKFLLLITLLFSWATQATPGPVPDEHHKPDTYPKKQEFDNFYEDVGGDIRALMQCAKVQKKLVVVAHRGGFAPGFPENSLASIERTISHIPAILELDVVQSADGIDYLHHDKTLDRTTSGKGPYNKLPWSEVQALTLRDNGYTSTVHHPISFDQMLSAVKGRAFLMLDMKSPSSNKSIVERLKKAAMLKSSMFIAYNHGQAKDILQNAPEALIALGASSPEQIAKIADSKLDKRPFVALAGGIGANHTFIKDLIAKGHYAVGGSHFGVEPPDAKLGTHSTIEEYQHAASNGFQLAVTNRPFFTYRYLHQKQQVLSKCH